MSSIEDIVRRIIREEIERYFWRTPVPDSIPRSLDTGMPIVPRRTGCTCPPGRPTAACPDPTCPWKPK